VLSVGGNVYLNRYNGEIPTLTAGELRVGGNFTTGGNSGEVLRPSGSHAVVFNGTGLQTISLAYASDARHYFNRVRFANPDSVQFASQVWINDSASISAGRVVGSQIAHVRNGVNDPTGTGWRVSSNHFFGPTPLLPQNVYGNMYFDSPVALVRDAHVTGTVTLNDGADFHLGGHLLQVDTDFTLDSFGVLTMTNAADVLSVTGNVYLNRYNSVTPVLNAGEIRVAGSFTTGGNSSEVFRPTGTHKVVLNGTSAQTASLAYGSDGRHFFQDLVITNPAGATVTNTTVARNLAVDAGGRLIVPASNFMAVTGDIVFTPGTFGTNNGSMSYLGTISLPPGGWVGPNFTGAAPFFSGGSF
jgi:hypothetical protein